MGHASALSGTVLQAIDNDDDEGYLHHEVSSQPYTLGRVVMVASMSGVFFHGVCISYISTTLNSNNTIYKKII